MKRNHKVMTLLTIFGLLMFVSVSGINEPVSSASTNFAGVDTEELSFVSSIYSKYLTEVKAKTHSPGACDTSNKIADRTFAPGRSIESLLAPSSMRECNPRSLWLLHRSLLI